MDREGTVNLTSIVRDPPSGVGLPVLFSKHTSLRSARARSRFSTDGGEQPVGDDAPRERDSERGHAPTRIDWPLSRVVPQNDIGVRQNQKGRLRATRLARDRSSAEVCVGIPHPTSGTRLAAIVYDAAFDPTAFYSTTRIGMSFFAVAEFVSATNVIRRSSTRLRGLADGVTNPNTASVATYGPELQS
jgi:hypothetical protein